jgi:MoaA/NifB/PqqE/SkfB family radical SAM enzyme
MVDINYIRLLIEDFLVKYPFIARKVKNVGRWTKGYHPLKPVINRFPPLINIELASICNANCLMCPNKTMTRKPGIMARWIYEKLIDECAHYNPALVMLHLHGEPMLDPYLPERISYAKQKGLAKVGLFTNCSLLTEELSQRILASGLDYLTISMEGSGKDTYEKIRRGLDYNQVAHNIINFMALRKKQSRKQPFVTITYTMVEEARDQVKEFKQYWERVVDSVHIGRAHNWGGLVENQGFSDQDMQARQPCSRLWLNPVVYDDGRVPLCCLDFNGSTILGDSKKAPLYTIWNGEVIQEMRNFHLRDEYDKIELCRQCIAWQWLNPWWW